MKNKTRIGRFDITSADDLDILLIDRRSEARAKAEAFAHRVYKMKFDADLKTFPDVFVTLTNNENGIISLVGVNTADKGRFFLEQYLDRPVEEEVSAALGADCRRDSIVEVSTLATVSSGLCRFVMAALTGFIMGQRKRFIAFTAVKTLRNTLAQLGIPFRTIARATPERLADKGAGWGTYYEASPEVILIDIEEARTNVTHVLDNVNSANSDVVASIMSKLFFKAIFLQRPSRKVRAA